MALCLPIKGRFMVISMISMNFCPLAATSAKELEQHSTFFMLMALYGLPPDNSGIRDQILGSPIVLTLSMVLSSLLRIPAKQLVEPALRPRLILLPLSLRVIAMVGLALEVRPLSLFGPHH